MNAIKIQYSKPLALLFLLIGPPFMLALAGVSAWISWCLLIDPFPTRMNVVHYVGGCIIFPPLVIAGAKCTWFVLRYGRETFFTQFRLSEHGIQLDSWRYPNLEVSWADIESAIYDRPMKTIVLRSRKLVAPIAITNNASYESAEFIGAVNLIKKKCAGRWRKKWL
jgi:hypothetical protein